MCNKAQTSVQNEDVPSKNYFQENEAKNQTFTPEQQNLPLQREKRPLYKFESGATYEGEWISSNRDGWGIHIWPDNTRHEGQWKDNKANGKGKLFRVNGYVFEGQWIDDKVNGYGMYIHLNGASYEGEWKDDLQSGFCFEKMPDGSRYEGYYEKGEKNGKGLFSNYFQIQKEIIFGVMDQNMKVNERITKFVDKFSHYYKFCQGTYVWSDGCKYIGTWINNNMHGIGIYTWPDGRQYEGKYENDKKHGFGIYTWPDGRRYEGNWEHGKQHGIGSFIQKGEKMTGVWEQGKQIKWGESEENQTNKSSKSKE